jgi:transcriptional regulator with XRE-family HTH domain
MSQAKLAKLVGVSRASVSQWENGSTKGLKPANLLRVAEILCPPEPTTLSMAASTWPPSYHPTPLLWGGYISRQLDHSDRAVRHRPLFCFPCR